MLNTIWHPVHDGTRSRNLPRTDDSRTKPHGQHTVPDHHVSVPTRLVVVSMDHIVAAMHDQVTTL